MHTRKEIHLRITKNPVIDPLGENSRYPAKKHQESVLKPNQIQ